MPASSASGPSCCSRRCCIVTTRSTTRVPWTASRQRCAFSRVAHRRRVRPSGRSAARPVLVATSAVRSRLAARRRRMLLALTLSTMLLAGVAALGNLPWWSPLIGVVLVTLFVVHLRKQARRSLLVDRRRQSLTRSAHSRQRRRDREDWVRRARERRVVESRNDHEFVADVAPVGSRCLGAGARTSADLRHRAQGRAACSRHRPHHARSLDVGPAARTRNRRPSTPLPGPSPTASHPRTPPTKPSTARSTTSSSGVPRPAELASGSGPPDNLSEVLGL